MGLAVLTDLYHQVSGITLIALLGMLGLLGAGTFHLTLYLDEPEQETSNRP